MPKPPLLSPQRLLADYKNGTISFEQWQQGMQQQCGMAIQEAAEDYEQPKLALLESVRCKHAARKLLKNNTEVSIREVFTTLSELDDFPPAIYLWNADNPKSPLHCFLREKRLPVLQFPKLIIKRMSAEIEIEYGGLKRHERTREKILLRRDWQGVLMIDARRVI